jgi:hypothetical protein
LAAFGICLTINTKSRIFPAKRETYVKLDRNSFFLGAMVAAGAFTFFLALIKRERDSVPPPYSRPEGGEREGEFELFIGS